jgi:hypothetical protein
MISMKNSLLRGLGVCLAALGTLSHSAAFAQDCIPQEDVRDGIIYAMPLALDAAQTKCGDTLAADGFLLGNSADFKARFSTQQDSAWPGALRLISAFAERGRAPGGNRNSDFADMFTSLPEDAIRPFVDAIVLQEIAKVIPLKECVNIERGLALMEPMPAENIGNLAAFLFEMSGVKNPDICPYDPS